MSENRRAIADALARIGSVWRMREPGASKPEVRAPWVSVERSGLPVLFDLRSVKLFAGLPDAELERISREVLISTHGGGETLASQGMAGFGFLIILQGSVVVTTIDGRSRRLGPGDYFGEMELLDHLGRSATVVAETDVVLAGVTDYSFKTFLRDHPEVAYRLLQALSGRLREVEALLARALPRPGSRG